MIDLILASESPRRKALLEPHVRHLTIVPPNCVEKVDSDDPTSTVMSLAFQKAYDVAMRYPDQVVVGADTVVFRHRILGKPIDRADAEGMLKSLSGHWHSVYTGIAIIHLNKGIKVIDVVETKVKMAHMSPEEISQYLDTEEHKDKAGAYALQGKGGLLVEGIQGEYTNVVGLPLHRLFKHLKAYFSITLF